MNQHRAPTYQILVDGQDISAAIHPRLIGLSLADNRGFEVDTIELSLDDTDGKLALPRRGAQLQALIGWQGNALVDKGTYTIDEVEHGGAPDVLTIRGKSADLRGDMNKLRERSWHDVTIDSIVSQLATRYSLTPSVGGSLKGQLIDHIDQTNESDLAFLTRLADQLDAIATVKSGRLLFIKAGQTTTASGQPLPAIQLTRQDGDRHRFSVADRNAYTGVVAYWQDTQAGEKKQIAVKRKQKAPEPGIKVDKAQHELLVGDSDNVKYLRHVYANEGNAKRAARAEWERLQRGVAEFEINLAIGRPELYPEQPATVSGFKPDIDVAPWLLTQVVHDLTNQGYTNRLQLEVKLEELPE